MALNTFGWTPADVITDQYGNGKAISGLTVWADWERTTQVTDIYDMAGVLTGTVSSLANGRYGFKAPDTYDRLYVWDGVDGSDPYVVAAHEALDAGQTTHAQAVAAAQAAQQAAVDAAALVGAPADTAIAAAVNASGSQTRTALSSTFAAAVGRSFMGRPLHPATNTSTLDGTNTPQSNGTDTGMNTLTKHRIVRPVSSVSVMFGNLRDFGGTANGNNITVRASVDMNGTLTPLYFNGRRDVVIEPDATVISDPVGVVLAAGSDLSVRTRVTVNSGEKWPNNRLTDNGVGEAVEYGTGTTDKTLTGTITSQRAYAYGPVTVLAPPTPGEKGTLIGVGDSIMQGSGDDKGGVSTVNTYDWGFVRRFAYANGYPFVNVGVVGDTAQGWATVGGRKYAWRKAAAANARWVICDFGINDLSGGRTLAQIQADLTALWTSFTRQGIKVYQTTITPKTNSTDSWATTANQTKALADDTIRTALNDWIRTTPAPLSGYFETADAVETARNSGIWKATYTTDGLHPRDNGHAAMSAAISASLLS